MARLDDLIAQVSDQPLRREMEAALATIKRRQRFGLVFEEHIPETSALRGLPIQTGSLVQRRDDPQAKVLYRVTATTPGGRTTIEASNGGEPQHVHIGDLLAVKRFGEPIYPALTLEPPARAGEGLRRRALLPGGWHRGGAHRRGDCPGLERRHNQGDRTRLRPPAPAGKGIVLGIVRQFEAMGANETAPNR
jgi:hypothetical protein